MACNARSSFYTKASPRVSAVQTTLTPSTSPLDPSQVPTGQVTVIENLAVAVCFGLALSVTRTPKETVPTFLAYPEIKPLLLSRSPLGRGPIFVNLYGATPPHAATGLE